jgi:uncharacterized caspase-like protein
MQPLARVLACIVILTVSGGLAAAQQQGIAEKRVALVVGNSEYRNVPVLPNPGRDAQALATVLRSVGFQNVQLATDVSRTRLIENLRAFARAASDADWAVVYYAGHGIEINGVNYLIPVDATLGADRDVAYEAVPLEQVLDSVDAARRLRVVILDACRDNPFLAQMKRGAGTRSVGRGLARIEPAGGTLVAYAAKAGQVALDGDGGGNSPFVASLIKYLPQPGIEINMLFRLVRDDGMEATGRKQEPFIYGSLPARDFFFAASK